MSTLSCHVLDTTQGCPAAGIPVALYQYDSKEKLDVALTDTDGRARFSGQLQEGQTYTLRFETRDYCKEKFGSVFFPLIEVHFVVTDQRHYHVPVLMSAYSYSTYRGS